MDGIIGWPLLECVFGFDSYEYHMDLCYESCSSRRLAVLFSKTFNIVHILTKFSTKFFHTCHTYRHHWVLSFCTIVTYLNLGWRSQGQRKARSPGFFFSHTFQLIRMKVDMVLKHFKLNSLILFLSDILWKQGKQLLFYWLYQTLLFGVHLDIYESN